VLFLGYIYPGDKYSLRIAPNTLNNKNTFIL